MISLFVMNCIICKLVVNLLIIFFFSDGLLLAKQITYIHVIIYVFKTLLFDMQIFGSAFVKEQTREILDLWKSYLQEDAGATLATTVFILILNKRQVFASRRSYEYYVIMYRFKNN